MGHGNADLHKVCSVRTYSEFAIPINLTLLGPGSQGPWFDIPFYKHRKIGMGLYANALIKESGTQYVIGIALGEGKYKK